MTKITLKGNTINTVGSLPKIGATAPDFNLTNTDLADISLNDFKDKIIVLNIFPSVDTPTCSQSVRRFNVEAAKHKDVVVLCISMDLPFALKRFCGAENIQNVIALSAFRHPEFGSEKAYGVKIIDGPIAGLLSRAVVIIDRHKKIIYAEQVAEIANEANYEAALAFTRDR